MFAVLFGPLAFGSVEPWSLAVLQSAMFAMLSLGGFPRPCAGMPREQAALLGAVVFVILIGLLQRLQPVPGDALRPLGPFTASAESTGRALLLWTGFLCLALGAPRVLASPESLRRLAWCVFLAGAAVSVIGILQSGQDNRILYGLREVGVMHKAFGPYYNRNHAAAVMAVSAVVGTGLFLSGFAEPGARRNLGALIDVSARNLSVIFLLGVLLLGLALSRSRGGANALAVGLVAGLFMSSRGRIRSRWVRWAWKAAFGLAAIAYLVFLYWHPIYLGLTDSAGASVDGSTAIRLSLYRSGWRMFLDSPLTGWGLGAFAQAVPPYQESKVALMRFGQAHNDWLQLLLECGVIGFGVFACALLILLRSAARAWGSCPQPELRWLSHWIIAAVLAMMFHSLVEFNLQIPANALIFFALLCWLAAPKPWRGGEEGLAAHRRREAAPAVVAVGLLLAALRPAIAWRHAQEARASRPERRIQLLEKAVSWDGGAQYWFRLGFSCLEAAVSKVPPDSGGLRQALGFSQRAVLADPFHPDFRRLHQAVLWRLGRRADAQEFR